MKTIWISIGQKVQEIQIVKEIDDKQIAKKLGVSQQRVNAIKQSLKRGRAVRSSTIHKLAGALEVDVQALIDLS